MEDLIEFFHKVGQLKKIKRTGWVLSKVPNPESVAEHSFRAIVMALVLADELKVNKEKFIKMAVIHDLAESIAGDITPHDMVEQKKFEIEKKAMQELSGLVNNGKEIMNLWEEFEQGKSKEASLVKQIDKLEMVFQALEYEQENKGKKLDLDEFWETTRPRLKDKKLIELFELLNSRRNAK